MKLAYFSPLNPQPSGISDYSEELLPYLATGAEITLFVDGFEPANAAIRSVFAYHDYRHNPQILQTLAGYDAIVYHLGNDHRYHEGMLEVARRHPGIVVFHDFALQDFFLGLAQSRSQPEIYLEEVAACHGYQATQQAAEALQRGSTPPLVERPLDFPLNVRLARSAEGIIVHSQWARARFAELAPTVPAAQINMPIKPPAAHRQPQTANDGAVVQIANFGLITPGKGIARALRALATLKGKHNFHYTLVGEPNSFFDVRALVRQYHMEDRVTVTGHVTLAEFEQRIAGTDIAINLRERTVGETSASLCRIMAAGVPAIVYDVAAFSELPSDAVIKINHDQHADALLTAYLERLLADRQLRTRIGANARRHILAEHDIEQGAAAYLAFIREVIARRPRHQFLNRLAADISVLGIPENQEQLLFSLAGEIAVLTPETPRPNGLLQPTTPATLAASNGRNRHQGQTAAAKESSGRLPKLAGIDYKRAALEYPGRLDAERSYYLRTKPFYNLAHKPAKHTGYGMDPETHRHFGDFANMAVALALPAGARILDVGCGSGWLSEYFARLGYDVTGIDISDDLIRMAGERLRGVPYKLDHETELRCRFLTHDIEIAPLAEQFDAIICYDSLHHLVDERAVFRHLAAMLAVGGILFILEGHMPLPGSATETELRSVMQQYGTLESPFSDAYLRQLLDEQGLAVVGDYVSINGLFEREMLAGNLLPLETLATDYHYLTCMKVTETGRATDVPDSRKPGLLRAEFTRLGPLPTEVKPGGILTIRLAIKNTGDTLWLNGQTVRAGVVMPALKVLDESDQIVSESHGQPLLPHAVPPGQTVVLEMQVSAPATPGAYRLKIDLVDQHICWFEACGSQPLLMGFMVA
jgi:SAM-dependent methyltransferase/glycosyltransferase involved in cell wall biosynthesis